MSAQMIDAVVVRARLMCGWSGAIALSGTYSKPNKQPAMVHDASPMGRCPSRASTHSPSTDTALASWLAEPHRGSSHRPHLKCFEELNWTRHIFRKALICERYTVKTKMSPIAKICEKSAVSNNVKWNSFTDHHWSWNRADGSTPWSVMIMSNMLFFFWRLLRHWVQCPLQFILQEGCPEEP